MDSSKNLEIVINHHAFTSSLLEIVTLVKSKSLGVTSGVTVNNDPRFAQAHAGLVGVCDQLLAGFSKDKTKEERDEFDQSRVIKKIYKTLAQHVDMMIGTEENEYKPDIKLFKLRNDDGKILTIIPGLNIGLVVNTFTDDELNSLWGHLYTVFISSVRMVLTINTHKKEGKIWNTVTILQDRVTKMGLTVGKDKMAFNPYVGLSGGNDINVNNLFANAEGIKQTTESGVGSMGLENFVDVDKFNNELKNIQQEDLDGCTENIVNMLGAQGDSDVNDICSKLVDEIAKDLKTNGLKNMMSTAQKVTEKLKGKLDPSKMQKTALQLRDFMENSERNLKNMKDENGNPIGEDVLNKLAIPMQFVQGMGSSFPQRNTQRDDDDERSTGSRKSSVSTSSKKSGASTSSKKSVGGKKN
jgi:hypothetical protein